MRHVARLSILATFFAASLCLAFAASLTAANAQARRAFVVGTGRYDNMPERQLERAVADAKTMAATLAATGFEVETLYEATVDEFWDAHDRFSRKLREDDIVLFYFSGHGIQRDGQSFLLGRNSPHPKSVGPGLLASRSISFNDAFHRLSLRRPKVRIAILDACRDDPTLPPGTRNAGGQGGLSPRTQETGTYVMYAAAPGQSALDKLPPPAVDNDPNSPYTRELVKLLATPSLSIDEIAYRVKQSVSTLAGGIAHEQLPTSFDGLIDARAFCPGAEGGRCPPPKTAGEVERDRLASIERLLAELKAERTAAAPLQMPAPQVRAPNPPPAITLPTPPATPAPNATIIPLKPPAVAEPKPAAPEPEKFASAVQEELKRIGCYRGAIDGNFGSGSRAALSDAASSSKALAAFGREPSEAMLAALRKLPARTCKIQCDPDEVEKNGECVPAPAPPKPVVSQPAPKPVAATPPKQSAPQTATAKSSGSCRTRSQCESDCFTGKLETTIGGSVNLNAGWRAQNCALQYNCSALPAKC